MTAPADNAGRAVFEQAYLPLLGEAHLADYQSVMTARQGTSLVKPGLGSRERIAKAKKLRWFPAQVNTSIRPGWFYHASQDGQVKSLEHLLDVYFGSVGGNAQFLLNLPPDKYSHGLREVLVDKVVQGSFEEAVDHLARSGGGGWRSGRPRR